MRDPKRIKRMLKLIEEIWTDNPDLRLCQLLGNAFGAIDPYNIEDEELEKMLKWTYSNEPAKGYVD